MRDTRLFVRRTGTGPLTVVLHGGPGAHHDYLLPQYDRLARGRELLYYDQRGGGRSPAAPGVPPPGWREHVADLDAIRGHLGLVRLTLCGYSWGALLALLYYLEHPDRVERLALVSPAAPTAARRREFETEFARRMAAPELQQAREELRANNLREQDPEAYRRRAFALSVAGYFRDFREAANLTPFRVTARTQDAVWASLGEYDVLDALGRGAGTAAPRAVPPAVVLHGTFDPIPIAGSRDLAEALTAPLVELETGHCPHVEATEEFVRALNPFLPRS